MKNVKALSTAIAIATMVILTQSCAPTSNQEEQIKASIVNTNDELFNKGNLNVADEVFTDDYADEGPAFIKEYVSNIRNAFPNLEVKVEPIISEGNKAAWLRTNMGTHEKAYMGYQPSGKEITWEDMVFSQYSEEGKIVEEWAVSNVEIKLQEASGVEGVFEYIPPLKGQSIIRNGRFVYLFGPSDGSGPMTSMAGTYELSDDIVNNLITYSNFDDQIGTQFSWTIKSWSGDTVTYELLNDAGEVTGGGRSIRVSK